MRSFFRSYKLSWSLVQDHFFRRERQDQIKEARLPELRIACLEVVLLARAGLLLRLRYRCVDEMLGIRV